MNWSTEFKTDFRKIAYAAEIGKVIDVSLTDAGKIMRVFAGQFEWAPSETPDRAFVRRVSNGKDDASKQVYGAICGAKDGISLGVLINRFKTTDPAAIEKAARDLEVGGLITSVRKVHKYNKKVCYSYRSRTS